MLYSPILQAVAASVVTIVHGNFKAILLAVDSTLLYYQPSFLIQHLSLLVTLQMVANPEVQHGPGISLDYLWISDSIMLRMHIPAGWLQ